MGIEVARQPTSIGTYRYDAFGAGRRTHGFRRSPEAARDAAREDEGLLFEAGRCSQRQEQEGETDKARETRVRRRDHRPGD